MVTKRFKNFKVSNHFDAKIKHFMKIHRSGFLDKLIHHCWWTNTKIRYFVQGKDKHNTYALWTYFSICWHIRYFNPKFINLGVWIRLLGGETAPILNNCRRALVLLRELCIIHQYYGNKTHFALGFFGWKYRSYSSRFYTNSFKCSSRTQFRNQ